MRQAWEQLITLNNIWRTNIPILSEIFCPHALLLKIVPVRDLYSSLRDKGAGTIPSDFALSEV